MRYDRTITIAAAGNRRSLHWPAQTLRWSELVQRLQTPVRGTETLTEYLRMSKAQQDDLKDVGGYVAGLLQDGRRKNTAVVNRDVVTLDMDSIPSLGTQDALKAVAGLGCAYCVYTTRKHEPTRPRLRVLLPLSRSVTADEYEPIARKLAERIGLSYMDPTTFQAVRMMYWPSCCADGEYLHYAEDRPMADPDGVLRLYQNWRDVTEWAQVPGTPKLTQRMLQKQEDPTTKSGVVGAFCRVYDIDAAMETFLPGVYLPEGDERFTYAAGSTTGGAVLYDDGKYLFSHHATDPCSEKLVNAFDLVRLHRYGDMDDEAQPGTPIGRLPSYAAMTALATADEQVRGTLLRERAAQVHADFDPDMEGVVSPAVMALAAPTSSGKVGEGITSPSPKEDLTDANWQSRLSISSKGAILPTVENARLILSHDPALRGLMAYDRFAVRVMVMRATPWSTSAICKTGRRPWTDADGSGLRWYLETAYGLKGRQTIDDAFTTVANANAFDDVESYILGLTWDGTPRVDRLFVRYLGAEDTAYTRAVTRKSLVACVARALKPGVKYDTVLTLVGGQGYGKSSVFQMLGGKWFNASLCSFDRNKEASELIQGSWIAELGELDQLNRSELSAAKQFITRTTDRFRAAYGRYAEDSPRRCVFFGTTNRDDFLRDETGERRFWPVPINRKMLPTDFDAFAADVDQIWAEARVYYELGERLFLDDAELEAAAKVLQERYREDDGVEGMIRAFLEKPIPADWYDRELVARRSWLAMRRDFGAGTEEPLKPRTKICAREVWAECYGKDLAYCDNRQSVTINKALARLGWIPGRYPFGGEYGQQRGYRKPGTTDEA